MANKNEQEQTIYGLYIVTQHLSNFDEDQRKAIVHVIHEKVMK